MFWKLLTGVSFFFIILSCNKEKNAIPSYLKIDSVTVKPLQPQGSLSSGISDAWIYIDNNYLGTFELPVEIPVLANGKHSVTVKPGIKVNGISYFRTEYPFYTAWQNEINFIPDQIISIFPITEYNKKSTFAWSEDFEGISVSFVKASDSDTIIKMTSEKTMVFEGSGSGLAIMDPAHPRLDITSASLFHVNSEKIFLEFNYRSEVTFEVGISGFSNSNSSYSIAGIYPAYTWKKMYVNIKLALNTVQANSFKIYFKARHNTSFPSSKVQLDNIKLLVL